MKKQQTNSTEPKPANVDFIKTLDAADKDSITDALATASEMNKNGKHNRFTPVFPWIETREDGTLYNVRYQPILPEGTVEKQLTAAIKKDPSLALKRLVIYKKSIGDYTLHFIQ